MDLNEVSVFIQVVQLGSFSAAAKKLGMPNSTVSHKVSSLERRLRITLIQRTTRKLNVTAAGKAYYERCLLGLEEIRAAEEELAALQGEPQGLLRMTAPIELGHLVLPDIISAYSNRYPKVRVEVILSDRRIDLLSENVDLAIRAGDLEDSTLVARKINSIYFAPVASPKYVKAMGAPAHPRELRQHSCIHFSPLGSEVWRLVGPRGTLDTQIQPKLVANDFATVRRWAVLGNGIALLPTHIIHEEIRTGKLVRILPDWRTVMRPLHFVYPAQRFVTPKLSAFIEAAADDLKNAFEGYKI